MNFRSFFFACPWPGSWLGSLARILAGISGPVLWIRCECFFSRKKWNFRVLDDHGVKIRHPPKIAPALISFLWPPWFWRVGAFFFHLRGKKKFLYYTSRKIYGSRNWTKRKSKTYHVRVVVVVIVRVGIK